MKRAFLWMVVPALLVALGFAQTPAASVNTDQTNIKGCLGGSDGNYTVVEDNTGHIFKITTSSVDLKTHLGHDVTLVGHGASGAGSSAADKGFIVTAVNLISDHCVAAAAVAAPTAAITTPVETANPPVAAAAAPAATVSTPAETVVTPPVAAAAPAATVTTPAETVVTPAAPTATVTTPTETAVKPAAPAATVTTPAETTVTPAAPTATVTTPAETVVTPAVTAAPPAATATHPTRLPAHPRKAPPATPPAAATPPVATAAKSSEPVSTPAAAADSTPPSTLAGTPSETDSTPAAAATTPAAPARRGSYWFLILFAVVVIVLGTMAPVVSKWRKRKLLEKTGAQNLSFNREASSDQLKSDPAGPRKAA